MEQTANEDIVKRLQRANGHLSKVIEMLIEGDAELNVAQQMQAVSKAVINAKNQYIRNSIDARLDKTAARELAELSKFL
ncbi:metal-sensing transcriptional repressor [Seleniivibrio sp.]|uniref:metal-sensing transcriptional repressor n=1 Tax=Seleniivibrio sp. TaxID=2898801 RepID=UPI0025CD2543|nr:metal-sensing transcriptional repressor [Seleniivibrio sp.]MCD8553201.1 metal-sensing transcriptional repressor [Seleniivibrio sp.]